MKFAKRGKTERGQALVEFAIVLPVLLLLLVGILEFGRAWNLKQVIVDAAREGARRAVIADPTITEADVLNKVAEVLAASNFDPAAANITLSGFAGASTGDQIAVRIEYPYQFRFLRPLINLVFTSNDGVVTLATEGRMRKE